MRAVRRVRCDSVCFALLCAAVLPVAALEERVCVWLHWFFVRKLVSVPEHKIQKEDQFVIFQHIIRVIGMDKSVSEAVLCLFLLGIFFFFWTCCFESKRRTNQAPRFLLVRTNVAESPI